MNNPAFDTVTRGFSRRASLTTLSGVGLAALALPFAGEAKKKKKAKKKSKNLCALQTQQCLDAVTPLCADSADPEECEALMPQCCQLAGLCEALVALSCAQLVLD